ncbi:MAG: cystathionine beta-lyase [Bacteroidia bacterium]|nr:MAG: cystathionine beta-lyase [Bacteroidia bacterium]
MRFGTKAIHIGNDPEPSTGAVITPIYQTSTYAQEEPGKHKGYEYSRTQNPTRTALQTTLASLENAKHALCFASGMAAEDTIIKLLQPGDEVICTNDLYGGSFRLFTKVFAKLGIKFHFIPLQELDLVEIVLSAHTKMFWVETPTNPLLNIIDIQSIVEIAKKNRILTVVDNTFASPFLQNPLDLGADMVVHSATKYLAGHSDVVMGCLMTNNDELYQQLAFLQNSCGAVPAPFDCFLVHRGIKTLHLRMVQHCKNASAIANYLINHPKVEQVYYPGLTYHKNHDIAKKQMKDFGGMVSFTLKNDSLESAFQFMKNAKLFTLAESLGGVESLVGHPATMTHASIPREDRLKAGLKDTLIRLSVGIEDTEDLLESIEYALSKV